MHNIKTIFGLPFQGGMSFGVFPRALPSAKMGLRFQRENSESKFLQYLEIPTGMSLRRGILKFLSHRYTAPDAEASAVAKAMADREG